MDHLISWEVDCGRQLKGNERPEGKKGKEAKAEGVIMEKGGKTR